MNATLLNPGQEPRWRTYLKSAAFLAPPIFTWGFSCVFVFPKLEQIWRDAGFANLTMMGLMQMSDFLMRHGVLIGAIIALLVLVEWRNGEWWPRYRRASVGTLVFLLNSAVLILMMAMLGSAMVAAPALARLK